LTTIRAHDKILLTSKQIYPSLETVFLTAPLGMKTDASQAQYYSSYFEKVLSENCQLEWYLFGTCCWKVLIY